MFHDFSKIADLQVRSAPLGGALGACISAIFQRLKQSNTHKMCSGPNRLTLSGLINSRSTSS